MNQNAQSGGVWSYFGRKLWLTIIGGIVLAVLLLVVHKLNIDTELYDIFAKNLTRIVLGYGLTNGAISISSFFKNNVK